MGCVGVICTWGPWKPDLLPATVLVGAEPAEAAALNGDHMQSCFLFKARGQQGQSQAALRSSVRPVLPVQARKTLHGVGPEPGALSGLPCCNTIG